MKNTILLFLSILFISCYDGKAEKREITQVWESYMQHVKNRDGKNAVQYVDSNTINYYEHILELCKTADSIDIENLRIDQKICVLCIRHSMNKSKLDKYDGSSLYAYFVQTGMLGAIGNDSTIYTLQNTTIKNNKATADVVNLNTRDKIVTAIFTKQDNKWKIDFSSTYHDISERVWTHVINESGKTENEFILLVLKEFNGVSPTNHIWHGMSE